MLEHDDTSLIENLLSCHPTAPRQLWERCFAPLCLLLRRHFFLLPDEAREDAANDAILALINAPQNYDSLRSQLMTYLYRIAHNHLVDSLETLRKHKFLQFVGDNVALEQIEEKNWNAGHSTLSLDGEEESLPPDIVALLSSILPDPVDRRIWEMISEGRQEVEEYACLLQINHLPLAEQKAEVKRQRERVGRRVRRRQDEFRRLLYRGEP